LYGGLCLPFFLEVACSSLLALALTCCDVKKDAAFACRVRLLRGAARLHQGGACDFSLGMKKAAGRDQLYFGKILPQNSGIDEASREVYNYRL